VAKLIYSSIMSLDENGNLDWAARDEEVHAFVNDLERRFRGGVVYLDYRVR
jgi:hypothetical protein